MLWIRRKAVVGGLALLIGIGSAAPASASARIGAVTRSGDRTTELNMPPQGNIVYFTVHRTADHVMTGLDVVAYTDPATTSEWSNGAGPAYIFNTDGDDDAEFYMDVWWDGAAVVGEVRSWPADQHLCWATTRLLGDYHYQAWFDPACIGDPTSLSAAAFMYWGAYTDEAPDEYWSQPWDRSGYWLIDAAGFTYPFGDAADLGDPGIQRSPGRWFTDVESNAAGDGLWALEDTGRVLTSNTPNWGSPPPMAFGRKATAISARRDDSGYWVFDNFGGVYAFGSAAKHGDMTGTPLNGPVIGSVATPSGRGYYMVGSDGGIFAFGDAKFRGSMGGRPLNKPVVGLVPDPDGVGYWLVASDGGVFAFEAPFRGSMGSVPLNKPVVGMVAYGNGYLMVGADGGVFNFSDKAFTGSLGSAPPSTPVVNITPLP